MPVATLAPDVAVFAGAVAGYGVALGMVDAMINMQAVALEHRYGRPILPSFHGAWTLGGLVGAALTLATAHLDLRWMALVAVVPLAALLGAVPPPRARRRPAADGRGRARGGRSCWSALALVLFYMVDTAAFTWGPTYLDHVVDAPARLVALATFPYLAASGLVRLAGDGLVHRYGPVRVLRVGTRRRLSGALAVVVFAPTWPVAVLGFLVLGGGVAVVAPLSFSAAARIAGGDTGPGRAAGPGGRGDRAVQPVQLRRRAARRGDDRRRRRGLAAGGVRRADGAGARDPAAGQGLRPRPATRSGSAERLTTSRPSWTMRSTAPRPVTLS